MQVLAGAELSKQILSSLKERVSQLKLKPSLHVVIVGDDPASQIYVAKKAEKAKVIGIESHTHALPAGISAGECKKLVAKLNADPKVTAILVQRPLPKRFDSETWISPSKDADCFHPENVGRLVLGLSGPQPCTPSGILGLLDQYKISVSGKTVCVVGRSPIVGKPMAALLLNRDATVIHTHSMTKSLENFTKLADILVVAAGKPGLIKAKHVKKGTVVIDVGIHRTAKGLVGDVDFEDVKGLVSAITPVPGGVGPLTIAMLLSNTVAFAEAAQAR